MIHKTAEVVYGVLNIRCAIQFDMSLYIAQKFWNVDTMCRECHFFGISEFIGEDVLLIGCLTRNWIESSPVSDDRVECLTNSVVFSDLRITFADAAKYISRFWILPTILIELC